MNEVGEPILGDLPPLRDQSSEWGQPIVVEPFREMLAYRQAILDRMNEGSWWRLSADFFGVNALAVPGFTNQLAWTSENEFSALMDRVRPASARDLTFPALVRLLFADTKQADLRLRKLAELGFPDALGAHEILRLQQHYKDLDGAEPTRILNSQEWMAAEHGHLGQELAQLKLSNVYAKAVFLAFCNEDGSASVTRSRTEQAAVCRSLLTRAEALGARTATPVLDQVLQFIALHVLTYWLSAWKRQEGGYETDFEGPAAVLWGIIGDWASRDATRRAAQGRALRQAWIVVDSDDASGPSTQQASTLDLAHSSYKRERSPRAPVDLPILGSSRWRSSLEYGTNVLCTGAALTFNPCSLVSPMWRKLLGRSLLVSEKMLEHGAKLVAADPSAVRSARFLDFLMPVPGYTDPLPVRAPVEALLLRAPVRTRPAIAEHLKHIQGPCDGELYSLLATVERRRGDAHALRALAHRSASALFRVVRDDPAFLHLWPNVRLAGVGGRRTSISDLRAVLSEPEGDLLYGSVGTLLLARVHGGAWQERSDRAELFAMSAEVPGYLAAGVSGQRLHDEVYVEHIRRTLDRLDHPDDQPVARLAGDVVFLRVASTWRPKVPLRGVEVDLREILPACLERLFESVDRSPSPDGVKNSAGARHLRHVHRRRSPPPSRLRRGRQAPRPLRRPFPPR